MFRDMKYILNIVYTLPSISTTFCLTIETYSLNSIREILCAWAYYVTVCVCEILCVCVCVWCVDVGYLS